MTWGSTRKVVISAMNSRYGGKYLFAGGKIDTQPVNADALSDLTDPLTPLISDFFENDDFITEHKVDDATTVSVRRTCVCGIE